MTSRSIKKKTSESSGSKIAAAAVGRERVVPNSNDVLCGRGKTCFDHDGNRSFRLLVARHLTVYTEASRRKEKTMVARSIIQHVLDRGGRFLKKTGDGGWYDGGSKAGKEKVGHALRDASTDRVKCMTKMHQTLLHGSTANQSEQSSLGDGSASLLSGETRDNSATATARAAKAPAGKIARTQNRRTLPSGNRSSSSNKKRNTRSRCVSLDSQAFKALQVHTSSSSDSSWSDINSDDDNKNDNDNDNNTTCKVHLGKEVEKQCSSPSSESAGGKPSDVFESLLYRVSPVEESDAYFSEPSDDLSGLENDIMALTGTILPVSPVDAAISTEAMGTLRTMASMSATTEATANQMLGFIDGSISTVSESSAEVDDQFDLEDMEAINALNKNHRFGPDPRDFDF